MHQQSIFCSFGKVTPVRTVNRIDNVVGDKEESGTGVKDSGVTRALLGFTVERPAGRLDLPESLGAVITKHYQTLAKMRHARKVRTCLPGYR